MKPTTTTTYPNWLSNKAITHMNGILRTLQRDAGLTEVLRFQYFTESDVLKRELPPNSLLYVPSSPHNAPFRLCCILAGKAKDDKARVTLSLSVPLAEKLRTFLLSRPQSIYRLSEDQPAAKNTPPPHIKALDAVSTSAAEDRAIFLADVRSHGREITRATAAACIGGQDPELIKDCITREMLVEDGPIIYLTAEGESFLKTCFDAPAEVVTNEDESMSEFDRLKAAVMQARAHYAAVESDHRKFDKERSQIAKDLGAARKEQSEAAETLKNLQERIVTVQQRSAKSRSQVLELESKQRCLPDEAQLEASQRELEAAEKAYKEFIAL